MTLLANILRWGGGGGGAKVQKIQLRYKSPTKADSQEPLQAKVGAKVYYLFGLHRRNLTAGRHRCAQQSLQRKRAQRCSSEIETAL